MVKVATAIKLADSPEIVQKLIAEREEARKNKDFARSDILRQQIAGEGYLVNDNPGGYNLYLQGDSSKQVARHYLVLFGSGEIAPSSVSIYRDLFLTFGKRDLKIALITTPAGFQPNVARVYGEIKDFLLASLPDFNLDIQIVFANTLADANNPEIVSQLDGVDIIFTGPGSPTYAAKHLRGTLLLTKIIDRVKNGVTLILASAATISFSHFALPVYEIYKVGDDLHWESGLDLYNDVWQRATIIPHFNNTEGGEGLDTSHCFVGRDRFARLHSQLPANEWILGIDEHTAYIVDLDSQKGETRGKGAIHNLTH
jgi:cyanophycinase-like exopeptidase